MDIKNALKYPEKTETERTFGLIDVIHSLHPFEEREELLEALADRTRWSGNTVRLVERGDADDDVGRGDSRGVVDDELGHEVS